MSDRGNVPTTIEAVVFDFDGVVLDTEHCWITAWRETFARYGADVDDAEMIAGIGTRFDAYELLVERATLTLPSESELRAVKRRREAELHAQMTVLPGVEEWIGDSARRGLPLAIASSSAQSWVAGHLGRLGLLDRFSTLSCCEDGIPPKPAPDCYVSACASLGVRPNRALAIEDSAHGVAAAKAAGLWCVAVPNALTSGLDLTAADLRIGSLAEVSLEEVVRLLVRA